MIAELEKIVTSPDFAGRVLISGEKSYKVKTADNFKYTDPIDNSVASNQVFISLIKSVQIYSFKFYLKNLSVRLYKKVVLVVVFEDLHSLVCFFPFLLIFA